MTISNASPRRINFRQLSRVLESAKTSIASPTARRGRLILGSDSLQRSTRDTSVNRKSKGVTFCDDSDEDDGIPSRSSKRLRISLRSLFQGKPVDPTVGASAAENYVGLGLSDRIRRALKVAADTRGTKMDQYVDRETIRRALVACGVPLDSKSLSNIEICLDRSGSGDIEVEVRRYHLWRGTSALDIFALETPTLL